MMGGRGGGGGGRGGRGGSREEGGGRREERGGGREGEGKEGGRRGRKGGHNIRITFMLNFLHSTTRNYALNVEPKQTWRMCPPLNLAGGLVRSPALGCTTTRSSTNLCECVCVYV